MHTAINAVPAPETATELRAALGELAEHIARCDAPAAEASLAALADSVRAAIAANVAERAATAAAQLPAPGGHHWYSPGPGPLHCTDCPTRVCGRADAERGAVPDCSPGERCPAGFSLGHHEVSGGRCLFCGTRYDVTVER